MAWDRTMLKNSRVRHVKMVLLFLVGAILLTQGYWKPRYDSWRCGQIAEELSKQYGLVIRYLEPSEFYVPPLPPQTNDPKEGFFIGKANIRYVQTALKGAKAALNKYPSPLIQKHLKAIFITGPIKIYGVQGAATYLNSWIYISALQKYEDVGIEQYILGLHHELSSLLLKGGSFPREQWRNINPADFKYLSRQIDVVQTASQKNRRDAKNASEWHKDGFVHDYGMSSLENDFNMYAELAMTNPANLIQLAQRYPKIKAKTWILVEYYSSLAPELGSYFESVGLTN